MTNPFGIGGAEQPAGADQGAGPIAAPAWPNEVELRAVMMLFYHPWALLNFTERGSSHSTMDLVLHNIKTEGQSRDQVIDFLAKNHDHQGRLRTPVPQPHAVRGSLARARVDEIQRITIDAGVANRQEKPIDSFLEKIREHARELDKLFTPSITVAGGRFVGDYGPETGVDLLDLVSINAQIAKAAVDGLFLCIGRIVSATAYQSGHVTVPAGAARDGWIVSLLGVADRIGDLVGDQTLAVKLWQESIPWGRPASWIPKPFAD